MCVENKLLYDMREQKTRNYHNVMRVKQNKTERRYCLASRVLFIKKLAQFHRPHFNASSFVSLMPNQESASLTKHFIFMNFNMLFTNL